MALLEARNVEGKTALYTAIEKESDEIADFLLEVYPQINKLARDSLEGNIALHCACKNGNLELITRLFEAKKESCLTTNFKGQTPLFYAVQAQNMEILKLFEEYKWEALMIQDYLGENPLFECARNGNEEIFNWFMGHNNFYKARGQQNYKG